MNTSCEMRQEIAAKIRHAMRVQNVTQAELARRLGVSRAYVNKALGFDANLTIDTLMSIAAALGCRVSVQVTPLTGEQ